MPREYYDTLDAYRDACKKGDRVRATNLLDKLRALRRRYAVRSAHAR